MLLYTDGKREIWQDYCDCLREGWRELTQRGEPRGPLRDPERTWRRARQPSPIKAGAGFRGSDQWRTAMWMGELTDNSFEPTANARGERGRERWDGEPWAAWFPPRCSTWVQRWAACSHGDKRFFCCSAFPLPRDLKKQILRWLRGLKSESINTANPISNATSHQWIARGCVLPSVDVCFWGDRVANQEWQNRGQWWLNNIELIILNVYTYSVTCLCCLCPNEHWPNAIYKLMMC